MAHEISIRSNGQTEMFYTGQTPWHKLGMRLHTPPTVEAGIIAAGLDWAVGTKPLFTEQGEKVTHQAMYRKDNGKILGVVGPGYTALQNVDSFKWFQPLLDAGEAELHTAGSLQEGRKVWVLAKICKPALEIADGDSVERFILLSNSHDGTRAVRLGFTPIRVVCANTLAMAHDADASKLVKILHTKNVVTALDDLRDAMNVANSRFEATAEQYRKLAKHKISRSDLRKYVKRVLDIDATTAEKDLPGQTLTKIESIMRYADHGRGNDLPSVKGTLWTGYQGITEFLSYEYGRSDDRRLDSLWWGQNSHVSAKALDIAIQMAS